MIYKINNDFSPIVCPPTIVTDTIATKIVICSGDYQKVFYGVNLKNDGDFLSFISLPFREVVTIGKRFISEMVDKRFFAVDFDMTANHNFGKIRHNFFTMSINDTLVITEDNKRIEDCDKPHCVGLYFGFNENSLELRR